MKRKPLELYIHIPFCKKKCGYCDFLSFPAGATKREKYFEALSTEVVMWSAPAYENYQVSTIFFGGGTPSLPDAEEIKKLLMLIRRYYDVSASCEITLECNPGTLTKEKLSVYKEAGINRLSIGLQSADNAELSRLGRIHTYEEFLESFELARKACFTNINVDLMSALPGQTEASWAETLAKVVALKPEHISAYSLILEEGTPFYKEYGPEGEKRGEIPDEETDRRMYAYTETFLSENGYNRYEISNYAKKGKECRHNKGYWTGVDYIGLGLGASSYFENTRFSNYRELPIYEEALEKMELPTDWENVITCKKEDAMEEFMFLGLRMMAGVSRAEFLRRFKVSMEEVYGDVIRKYKDLGLLCEEREWLRLTKEGIDVSNTVFADFLLDREEEPEEEPIEGESDSKEN